MRKLFLITFLVIVLSACQAQTKPLPANSEVKIAIATDLHLLSDQLFDYDPETMDAYVSGDGRLVFYTSEIMDALSTQLSVEKPDVLIISGDLTHNGEKKSHEVLSKKLKALEEEGVRVLVVPGNHDIENFLARSLEESKWVTTDTIVAKDFERLYKDFGYADALERDPNGLSYVSELSEDLWVLMMDSNRYRIGMPTGSGEIRDVSLEWMESILMKAQEKGVEVFSVMHHNLLIHSPNNYIGNTLNNYEEVVELYDQYDVRLNFSGHIHAQGIVHSEHTNPIYDVVTSSISISPIQYGWVTYQKENGFEYNIRQVDVQAWAVENGKTDLNLLNFKNYARDSFKALSYGRTLETLTELALYDEEMNELLASSMSEVNAYYFPGHIANERERFLSSEGVLQWMSKSEPQRTRRYVEFMLQEKLISPIHLKLQTNN